MADEALGEIAGLTLPIERSVWRFDDDDFLLYAMCCDPVYGAELLWEDPSNRDYAGCYRVRDYQYPLFRAEDNYAIFACARSVGKTESIKARSQAHVFKRQGENLLLTAPELIHLLPLTDAIEERIAGTRLLRDFLDTRNQKTGFTHRPFGAEFADGTKIIGRIPKLSGTGVKGQHQPDLIVDEGQDYPEKGWTEVHETVLKDHVDETGEPDFTYHVYGVHSGARDSGFYKRTSQGGFTVVQITALMRPGWGKKEKEAAAAAYGGTSAPDYRRNILGEAGAGASAFFVTSRLMACMDQNRESDYNTMGYKHQRLQAEEVDSMGLSADELLDLPSEKYDAIWMGQDVGLTEAPSVITVFAATKDSHKKNRLRLIRRYTLERFRVKTQREVLYKLAWHFGGSLMGFGMDITGLGFPMFQEMEDDEDVPPRLLEVTRGYFFNSKMPVSVDERFVTKDNTNMLRDQYGNMVKIEEDPITGQKRYVTYMSMIEASTRYLREFVDSSYFQLPFDPEVIGDMQGETVQRVRAMAARQGRRKPAMFHVLDSMRAMAMVNKAGDIEEAMQTPPQAAVLDRAMQPGADVLIPG